MSDGIVGRWGAVAREAFAVLAAILIAFALDAWWDGRVERAEMREALDAVRVELGDNIDAIQEAMRFNGERAVLVAEALDYDEVAIGELSDEAVARYTNLPQFQIVTLALGATAAFIEGGHLRVLDDAELKPAIAGLPQIQLEIDEEAASVDDMTLRLNEALLGAMPIRDLRSPQDMMGPGGTRTVLRTIALNEDVRRAFYARTFLLNAVYGRELQFLMERLERTRAQIHDELGMTPDPGTTDPETSDPQAPGVERPGA